MDRRAFLTLFVPFLAATPAADASARARAGDLPVERPAKLELVINRAAAAPVGLAVPSALLLRADSVID